MGARLVDLLASVPLAVLAAVLLPLDGRPLARWAVAWLVFVAYDAVPVAALGATPGKLAVGIRVVGLDRIGRPSPGEATRRAMVNATFLSLVVVGWMIWALGSLADALGRGVADRAANTMVVRRDAHLPVALRDLPGYADAARPPRLVHLGRVGDLEVRARARMRRLIGVPALAAVIGALALTPTLTDSTLIVLVVSTAVWLVAFVADETLRIHRSGVTTGHGLAGLVVVDRRTGLPPSMGRSLVRAVVLGLTLYVPVLWPLLGLSAMLMMWSETGRGLHDLAGGTVVVGDPRLDPEIQRRRAMRMRMGQAA